MHQALFADIEIAAAGAALPVVGLAQRQVLVEQVVVGEGEHGRFPFA